MRALWRSPRDGKSWGEAGKCLSSTDCSSASVPRSRKSRTMSDCFVSKVSSQIRSTLPWKKCAPNPLSKNSGIHDNCRPAPVISSGGDHGKRIVPRGFPVDGDLTTHICVNLFSPPPKGDLSISLVDMNSNELLRRMVEGMS